MGVGISRIQPIGRLRTSHLYRKSIDDNAYLIALDSYFTQEPDIAYSGQYVAFGSSALIEATGIPYNGATITTYAWTVVSGTATITSASSASTTVTGLVSGATARLRITVTDSKGNSSSIVIAIYRASATSARWNFTKTAFAVAGNNNMIAAASRVGEQVQVDAATKWGLHTNAAEWEMFSNTVWALNNGEGGSSAGSPTYTTFSANELQGGFVTGQHTENTYGQYPLELGNLPPGRYRLTLIGSVKATINGNVPNGIYRAKFGKEAEQQQTIAQESNYTTPGVIFTGNIEQGERIQFGPYTTTEKWDTAAILNCLLIERLTTHDASLTESIDAEDTASATGGNTNYFDSLVESVAVVDTPSATGGRANDVDGFIFCTNWGISDTTVQSSIDVLMRLLKANGFWTISDVVLPIAGGTAFRHSGNLKDPRNLDIAHRLRYWGNWVHSATGMVAGTVDECSADTFWIPSENGDNVSLGVYLRTNVNGDDCDLGAYEAGPLAYTQIWARFTDVFYGQANTLNSIAESVANTDSRGWFFAARTGPTASYIQKNATQNTGFTAAIGKPRVQITVGSRNSDGTRDYYSPKEIAFVWIQASNTTAISTAQGLVLQNIVQAYQSHMGRQIGNAIYYEDVNESITATDNASAPFGTVYNDSLTETTKVREVAVVPSSAIVEVQTKKYGSAADNTSHTITFDTQPVQGNLLILAVAADWDIPTPPSGWTQIRQHQTSVIGALFYKVAGSSEPTSVSVVQSTSSSMALMLFEFSGLTAAPFDTSAYTIAAQASPLSTNTTPTTAQAKELLIALAAFAPDNNTEVISWSNGFKTEDQVIPTSGTIIRLVVASAIVDGVGAYSTAAEAQDAPATQHLAMIATFKQSAGTVYNDSLTESTGVTDSATAQLVTSGSRTEPTAVTDSITGVNILPVAIAESQPIADTIVGVNILTTSLTEAQPVTDSITQTLVLPVSLTEAQPVTDSSTSLRTTSATLSEPTTVTDNYVGGSIYNDSLTESITATESESAQTAFNPALTESVASAAAQSATQIFASAYVESVTTNDVEASTYNSNNTLGSSIVAGDVVAGGNVIGATLSDPVAASDNVSGAVVIGATLANPITANESSLASVVMNSTLANPITASETEGSSASSANSLANSVAVNETEAATQIHNATNVESIGVIVSQEGGAVVNENVVVDVQQVAGAVYNSSLSEGISAQASQNASVSINTSLAQSIVPNDSEGSICSFNNSLQEATAPSETRNSSLVTQSILSELTSLSDSVGGSYVSENDLSTQFSPIAYQDNSVDFINFLFEDIITIEVEIGSKAYDDVLNEFVDFLVSYDSDGGIVRVNVNGIWKIAIPYIKINGVWKPAILYFKVGQTWKNS